jgi:hypothetical protein
MATVIFYKDLPLDFTPHPISGDVRPIVNEVAIKRALINLVRTRKGTRPFDPEFGTNIHKYLFDTGPLAENEINKSLYNTIKRYEPRVTVTKIKTEIDGMNGIEITIEYYIKNANLLNNVQTVIRRAS